MSWYIGPLKEMRSLFIMHATNIISCYFISSSTRCVTSETYFCSKRMASSVPYHYNDVIMGAMTSQITSLTIVYSIVYSGANQRKHQSSESLAFVRGIQRWQMNSPHKWPVTCQNVSIWWRHHASMDFLLNAIDVGWVTASRKNSCR